MPVLSTHCFANHRGGVGKTTLTFQVSAAYALAHPSEKVFVIDASDAGDLSEMLMGGLFEERGRQVLMQLVPLANTTRLFLRALACHSSSHLKEALEQDGEISAVVSKVIKEMPKSIKEASEFDSERCCVNLEEFAIPLEHVNPRLPSNMYVCPSGLDVEQSIAFSEPQRYSIISVLRESFKLVNGYWKIFIDTDAGFENDIYCSISVGISNFCLIPLHADMVDWYRVEPLLAENKALRESGHSDARVQMILWNGLTVKFNSRCFSVSASGASKKCVFTPTKAEQDVIRSLNELVFKEAEKNPELFLHYEGGGMNPDEFHSKSCMCIRNFSVVGVASRDSGIPIACISPGTFHGQHMTYLLNEAVIERCRENMNELVKAIDAATELVSLTPLKDVPSRKEKQKVTPSSALLKVTRSTNQGSGAGRKRVGQKVGGGRMKRKRGGSTQKTKTYNTRHKYPLRDRVRRNAVPLGLIELTEHSSTSTVLYDA
ncbi:hypothetical protein GOP47_0005350 [Adiantum capillus-veneris]|uniref:AAA domain-containing protein n=1 Tax=Adiantum capillus-veneris TaxID=13818 RepID=A0A9D4ZNH6_ADICA|nr:hypothetical protein GOP47_0005350 [Adiantum capillus-veneris]